MKTNNYFCVLHSSTFPIHELFGIANNTIRQRIVWKRSYTTSENIFSDDPLIAKGLEVLRVREVIQYYHPFWGWKGKSTTATIWKVAPEDSIPLKLDTRDVLERTHSIKQIKKYINGALVGCLEDDNWNKVGSYQLVPGKVKDFHKRKSLEAQRLEHIQQQLDDQFQQVAKEFGLPMDLLQNGGKKQKAVEENNVTTLDKHYQEKKRHETQSPNSKNNNGEGGAMVQLDNEAVEENTTKHQENNTSDEDSNDESKNCSDEPTAIREPKPTIEIVLPDVEMSDSTPHVLQDSDSVSTFRSKVSTKSILKQPSSRSTPTSRTDPTSSTSFDDRSVSKLLDSTSKLLAFEDKFNQVTQELHQRSVTQEAEQKENRAMLTAILNALQLNQGFYANTTNAGLLNQATAGGQSSAPADQDNSLSQSTMTGGPSGAAGSGS
jgi:hypothetical protein